MRDRWFVPIHVRNLLTPSDSHDATRHDGSPEWDSNSDDLSRVFSAAVLIVQRASRHPHCFDTSTSLPRLRAVTLINRLRLMRAYRWSWYRHVQACLRVSAAHCARVTRQASRPKE